MVKMVRLKALRGACCVAYLDKTYPVVDGFVTVPEDAVPELTKLYHGFTLAPEVAEPEQRNILRLNKQHAR